MGSQFRVIVLFCWVLVLLPKLGWSQSCSSPQFYYYDLDGDNYGGKHYSESDKQRLVNEYLGTYGNHKDFVFDVYLAYGCLALAPGAFPEAPWLTNDDDCDDYDPDIHPGSIWYYDKDGDGDGDPNNSKAFDCDPDPNYVKRPSGDCNDNDPQLHSDTNWYYDEDGDGYAGSAITIKACVAPPRYYAVADDCNDENPLLHPKTVWYQDKDGDGWGGDQIIRSCIPPTGYVSNTSDWDDQEPCITNHYPQTYYRDSDGDGYGNPSNTEYCSSRPWGYVTNRSDCDDSNSKVHPYTSWYRDADGDGYGNQNHTVTQCSRPSGYVLSHSDIDDNNDMITDIPPQYFYQDLDGDGHGNPSISVYYSEKPDGYVTINTDCDDNNALMHSLTVWYIDQDGDGSGYNPVLLEQTNGLRNTPGKNTATASTTLTITGCYSGTAYVLNQEDFDDQDDKITHLQPQYYYFDADGDHYGVSGNALFQSEKPQGYASQDGDCNDQDPLLHPQTAWYKDHDKDQWGDPNQQIRQCEKPEGYVDNQLDHDDTTDKITHIAPQNFYRDQDQDQYGDPGAFVFYSELPEGYVSNALDCNDQDAALHPDTIWYQDNDGDGWGGTVSTTQCATPTGHVINSQDLDDTTIHIDNRPPRSFFRDQDQDRYGDPKDSLYYSYQPEGYVTNKLDCDDQNKYRSPQTLWYQDSDGDGLGDPNSTTASCPQPLGYVDNKGDLSDQSQYITDVATSTFYKDSDGDGFGDPLNQGHYSFAPPDYSILNTDCNDQDPLIHPQTQWYLDSDGDGYGQSSSTIIGCDPSQDYVLNKDDLDDQNPYITDIPGRYFFRDADGDSYGDPQTKTFRSRIPTTGYVTNDQDCNDRDRRIHPQTQWYDDRDGDGFGGPPGYLGCNAPSGMLLSRGDYDDSTDKITNIPPRYFYRDADQDGYGDPRVSLYYSLQPSGYLPAAGDCNDQDPLIHPNTVWYRDKDQDGFGDAQDALQQCEKPQGYTDNTQDIDDNNPHISDRAPQNYYRDQDQDGYGTPKNSRYQSNRPEGYVVPTGDCDDNNPLLHPKTVWFYDFDQDGFGGIQTLEGCLQPPGHVSNHDDLDDNQKYITDLQPRYFYQDFDQDGYGNPEELVYYSLLPQGYVTNNDDCDDTHQGKHPLTRWFRDQDRDGSGNESDYIIQCEQPEGYVGNADDCDDFNDGRVGGLVGLGDQKEFEFDSQTHYSDCAVAEFEAGETQDIPQLDFNGLVYVDVDQDGMGDPEQPVNLMHTPEPNFVWSVNNHDACPEEFGPKEYKGCPEPLVLGVDLGTAANQVSRTFYQKESKTSNEKIHEIEDPLLFSGKAGPNPNQDGLVYAHWDEPVAEHVNTIIVFGFNNNILYKSSFELENSQQIKIDLSQQPSGLYFIQFLYADGRGMTRKIFKQ
jgi:hypothetical protein